MQPNLPSSFASAAAGQNANRDARAGRNDGRGGGSGEWARRDGRPNGTLTFRRPSTTPGQSSQPAATSDNPFPGTPLESAAAAGQTPGASGYDFGAPSQYAKEMILGILKNGGHGDTSGIYEDNWTPNHVNGNSSRGWGKSNSTHTSQDPSAAWSGRGVGIPYSIQEISSQDREIFASDVNSPLKPPVQTKEGSHPSVGPNGRKLSISHGSVTGYGLTSPTSATRPGARRRETTDSNPFSGGGLASPTVGGRFPRDDPFSFGRKGLETKDQEFDEPEEDPSSNTRDASHGRGPFGTLARNNTSGSANLSSLWGQGPAPTPQSASGMGSFGNFALPTPTSIGDKGFGSVRGGSRFANLIPKDSSESMGPKSSDPANPDLNRPWRTRPRTDTDPYGEDELSGSAALGGDTSPPPLPQQAGRFGAFETPIKGTAGDFGMSGLGMGGQEREHASVSPSETNPYRSPPAERGDDNAELGADKHHGTGIASEQHSNFSTLSRGFPSNAFDGSDRSQTSSAGPKTYPSLPNLTGWPAGPTTGTPDRDRASFGGAFGSSLFNPMGGDLQSPGLSNLGGVFGPPSTSGVGATGSIGRSKLGSLFPPAMQAQMQSQDAENLGDSTPDLRQSNPLGAIGRNAFAPQHRDTDSPMRAGRGVFEELFPSSDSNRSHSVFGGADAPQAGGAATSQSQSFTPVNNAQSFSGSQSSAEPPSTQVRQMVMPDRMRWVYLDPSGRIQGPFTGLEMNDWYKANFFTPDLRVKKVEDQEFEPLGQLIRRIGNSREPFLVPQIGVPHGPPAATGAFSPASSAGVIPPLSGVFPSFGRTLTADEQNNLERRKQEEQYVMAQQREFLARQQAMSRIQGPGGAPGPLHHHSSAHSLQSQPSFGSMTSPGGMPPHPPIGAMPPGSGFYEPMPMGGAPPGSSGFRDEDVASLNPAERQMLANTQGSVGMTGAFPPQPFRGPPNEGSLRTQLPGTEELPEDSEGFRERLKEFEGLRAEHEAEQIAQAEAVQQSIEQEEVLAGPSDVKSKQHGSKESTKTHDTDSMSIMELVQQMSLTQQVQQAQAAAAAQNVVAGLPMPFPPPVPQGGTPLPAPTAQRARSNLPEQYSRSHTQTPETSSATEPPPLAPWAKESATGSRKGPSLKEIQEAEAKKAAKAEESAAAARRAALEQEAATIREKEKAAAVASGIPTSSTWGNGSPVAAVSPWSKPAPVKPAPGLSGPVSNDRKKTLADIQREEEVRKQKAKDMVVQTGQVTAAGKRYADLANKSTPPGLQPAGSAGTVTPAGWATVGAGGRVKIPTGPSSQARTVSASTIKPSPVAKPVSKPAAAIASTPGKADATGVAMDEFNKWLHRELGRGISGGVDIETLASALLDMPLDATIISEIIYNSSETLNGKHFAEEFIRRKKLADKGIVEKQPASTGDLKTSSASSGWSEVAKKGGNKEQPTGENGMQGAGFKVVPGRKKGKKN